MAKHESGSKNNCDTYFAYIAWCQNKQAMQKKTILGLPYAQQLVRRLLAQQLVQHWLVGSPIAKQHCCRFAIVPAGLAAGSSASTACCTHSAG